MWFNRFLLCCFCMAAACLPALTSALCYQRNVMTQRLLGSRLDAQVQAGDHFTALAQRFDVGVDALQNANPGLDANKPLPYAAVIIPQQVIMPDAPYKGILINIAQKRLYAFYHHGTQVCTYPIGIGEVDWQTPLGHWSIIKKMRNPVWLVPDSIYAHRQKIGKPVPHRVPSGPDNPLGYYAMRLNNPTYLIHGTDDPSSVGRRSSAGCMHLFAPDIQALFMATPVGTAVNVVNQPYEVSKSGGAVWLEADPPLEEMQAQWRDPEAQKQYLKKILLTQLTQGEVARYWQDAWSVAQAHTGLPVVLHPR